MTCTNTSRPESCPVLVLAKETTIAGYDILNEPWIYSSVNSNLNATNVDTFYLKVVAAIRSVDPNHIIFLEPTNMNTFGFLIRSNIVWSPHFYVLALARIPPTNRSILEADLAAKYKKFVLEAGTPMWIGEFGAFMNDAKSMSMWIQHAIELFGKYQVGWAYWAYNPRGNNYLILNSLLAPS